jgi:hypothetical protein
MPPSPKQRARDFITAHGLPLIPARVNDIPRQMGLEVSVAPMLETIARIRAALQS